MLKKYAALLFVVHSFSFASQNHILQEAKNSFFRAIKMHNEDQDNSRLLSAIDQLLQSYPTLINEKIGWQECPALWHACDEKNDALATLLIKHKADLNTKSYYQGEAPLHQAVSKRNLSLVEALLSHKASPNTIDNRSMTPLNFAVRRKCNPIEKHYCFIMLVLVGIIPLQTPCQTHLRTLPIRLLMLVIS